MSKAYRPMKRVTIEVDISHLSIEPGYFIVVASGPHSVEIVCKDDGTFQVCVDDETLKSGIHRYKEIYGPDPFKEEKGERK